MSAVALLMTLLVGADEPASTSSAPDPAALRLLVARIGGDRVGSSDDGLLQAFSSAPDRSSLSTLEAQIALPLRLDGRWYLMPGLVLGAGEVEGEGCLRADSGRCVGPRERWSGFAGRYGLSLGLVHKVQDGQPFSLLWLPKLKVEHLVYEIGSRSAGCDRVYAGSCSGWRADNLLVSLAVEADFIHTFPLGCGLGAGVGVMVGDLAERTSNRLFARLSAHWAFGR